MGIMNLHGKMTEVLAGCADDAAKLDDGNKAAGMRLRKALKALKDLTQETRKASIEVGKGGTSDATSDATSGGTV